MIYKKPRLRRKTQGRPRSYIPAEAARQPMPYKEDTGCATYYTDGSAVTNPGRGGWSFVLAETGLQACGGENRTTNNRMELQAVIEAMKHAVAHHPHKPVKIVSDSQYAINGASLWMASWKRNNWEKKSRKGGNEVKNVDLWKIIDRLKSQLNISFSWVKGHNGNQFNEIADRLADTGARSMERHQGVASRHEPVQVVNEQEQATLDDGLPGCGSEDFVWTR